ncbi:MAG: cytochrome c peroxidase [Bacteroidota bacterium]
MMKQLIFPVMAVLLLSCGGSGQKKKDKETSGTQTGSNEYAELDVMARQMFGVLPAVAENPENEITDEKVKLGKVLYFDNRLSKDDVQSCNTCHDLNNFGVDNEALSEGNDGGLGDRNSPTTLNAALHFVQFWDGSEPDVEAQAGGPILNPDEMAMPSEEAVEKKLSAIDEYQELFAAAFPDEQDPVTFDNIKKAIGAFERKLIAPSKFDDYIAGDDQALSDQEKRGLQTYINSGCLTCHMGPLLGGNIYQKFGLFGDYWELTKSEKIDNGRFDITGNEAEKYMFKVPSLRNVEKTAPYFHDGSVNDLGESIRIMAKLGSNKDLNESEIGEITDFLKTLTGDIPAELKEQP